MIGPSKTVFSYLLTPVLLIILLTGALLSIFSYRQTSTLLYEQYYQRLESVGLSLSAALPKDQQQLESKALEISSRFPSEHSVRLTFINTEGRVLADTHEDPLQMENHSHRVEIRKALEGEDSFSLRTSPTLSIPMLYHGKPIFDQGGEVIGVLRSSLPAAQLKTLLKNEGVKIFLLALLVVSLAVTALILVSRHISGPLKQIAADASRYASFDFSKPIHADGPQEIVTTAEALEKMASALTKRISEVSRKKQELEAVLSGMNEAVIVLDEKLTITELNDAALRLVEYSPESPLGKSLIQLIRNTELYDFAQDCLLSESNHQRSLCLSTEGREIHLQVSAASIEAELVSMQGSSTIRRLVLVLNDISQLKRLEQIRKDFVSNVSHELKTPITSIRGFSETLLDGALEEAETARKFVSIIGNQTERLSAIIEDLLTLSSLEQKSSEETGIFFDLIPVSTPIEEAIEICKKQAEDRSINIESECPRELKIRANSRLLEQALVNLIENAVKYCPEESQVKISCSSNKEGEILIAVSDNGPGIPEEDRQRIFERFYRVEKARSRDLGGTGLGLAIVKHIMLSHGGSVELASGDAGGTSFLLRFPAVQPPSA